MKTTRFIEGANILGGNVAYDGFAIDVNEPLSDQVDSLRQDMLQIEY